MKYKKIPLLSDRLKYIRQLHHLSQLELAVIAETTQQAIQQAEAGKALQPRYLPILAKKLNITLEWLLSGDGTSSLDQNSKNQFGFSEKSSEVLNNFFSMPEKDQDLILQLMKARQNLKDV